MVSTEVVVAFITGILGPVTLLYLKNLIDSNKLKPDMVKETLRVSEIVISKLEHMTSSHRLKNDGFPD